jgi:DmsE family decaheme c-type cytochrome
MPRTRSCRILAPLLPLAALGVLVVAGWGTVQAQDEMDCAGCHEKISRHFETTVHGRIAPHETLAGAVGCATCHGDGAEHVDQGGDPTKIRRFKDDMNQDQVAEVCRTCHRSHSLNEWEGSAHALNGVTCASCHKTHVTHDLEHARRKQNVDACLDCHADTWAQFQYPSHHPVREGHMDCVSCHQPHGTSIGDLRTDERSAELCLGCHTQYAGPFIFEHEPVYEGCDLCHAPHGAPANNLLVQNEPFLCLQCHELHFHSGLEGDEDTEVYVPRFDPANGATDQINTYPDGLVPNPWGESGYKRAFTTKCTQCHTQVHGSDSPTQTVPGLGQGLAR